MNVADLRNRSVLLLGLGREGQSTYRYLRAAFPNKILGLADQLPLEELDESVRQTIRKDSRVQLHLGRDYLKSLSGYEVIVKSPGVPVTLPEYRNALKEGRQITSQTALVFAEFPGKIVGVTGTKGKSTTASLIHAILQRFLPDVHLVGNIGVPPLDLLSRATAGTVFVYELSSHQLEGLRQSPQIAVLLNVVPEHLDYYESFEQYAEAKRNITRYQTSQDFLVYDADDAAPATIASRSQARKIACSLEKPQKPGCFVSGDKIVCCSPQDSWDEVLAARDVPLLGRFNLLNVAAAVAVGKLVGAPNKEIAEAVRAFRPLEHRLEPVGVYGGVSYYNDSIATVPEATIAALDALGPDVETVLLGGMDRGLDFSLLAKRLLQGNIRTVILFSPTGERIWRAVCKQGSSVVTLPQHFIVKTMEEAVALARRHTAHGRICLHSPASPSFGLFRDYRERGERFKRAVRQSS